MAARAREAGARRPLVLQRRASGSSPSRALRVCTSLTAALSSGTAKLGWRRTGSM